MSGARTYALPSQNPPPLGGGECQRTLTKIEQAGFFWAFEGIPLRSRITIPGKGRYPDACFDHIFTRNLGRSVAKVLNSSASDHRPVVVDLAIEP